MEFSSFDDRDDGELKNVSVVEITGIFVTQDEITGIFLTQDEITGIVLMQDEITGIFLT